MVDIALTTGRANPDTQNNTSNATRVGLWNVSKKSENAVRMDRSVTLKSSGAAWSARACMHSDRNFGDSSATPWEHMLRRVASAARSDRTIDHDSENRTTKRVKNNPMESMDTHDETRRGTRSTQFPTIERLPIV
jgi:hypothetical protein